MTINIEDFSKLDIRVGTILSAEKIPDSDKLLKLSVDFGAEKRQIVSGIALSYPEPELLVNKQAVFVVNLEPRKLRGEISEGMILAVKDENDMAIILSPEKTVASGTKVG